MGIIGLKEVGPYRRDFGIQNRETDELVIMDHNQSIRLVVAHADREETLISVNREYEARFGHRLDNLTLGENHVWKIIQNMAPFVWKMSIIRRRNE